MPGDAGLQQSTGGVSGASGAAHDMNCSRTLVMKVRTTKERTDKEQRTGREGRLEIE